MAGVKRTQVKGRTCTSNPKSEISDWTCGPSPIPWDSRVRFEVSDLQDSSNFKCLSLPATALPAALAAGRRWTSGSLLGNEFVSQRLCAGDVLLEGVRINPRIHFGVRFHPFVLAG